MTSALSLCPFLLFFSRSRFFLYPLILQNIFEKRTKNSFLDHCSLFISSFQSSHFLNSNVFFSHFIHSFSFSLLREPIFFFISIFTEFLSFNNRSCYAFKHGKRHSDNNWLHLDPHHPRNHVHHRKHQPVPRLVHLSQNGASISLCDARFTQSRL